MIVLDQLTPGSRSTNMITISDSRCGLGSANDKAVTECNSDPEDHLFAELVFSIVLKGLTGPVLKVSDFYMLTGKTLYKYCVKS